jgi:hypothetical protein
MALTKTPIELSSTPGIVDNSNDTAITIDSSENVGIGGAPAYKLDVASAVIQFGDSTDAFAQYKSSAGNWHVGANSSNAFAFYSGTYGAGTERMRIDSSGNLILKKNLVLESTSEGIDFSGVGSSAQTLDDYEEGTFTPSYGGSGADPTATYLSQTLGRYTKIGDLVHCQVEIRTSAISGGSGDLEIKGFPFTANSLSALAQGAVTLYNITFNTSYLYTFEMQASTTYGFIRGSNSGTTSQNLPVSGVINTSPALIRLTVSYKVA